MMEPELLVIDDEPVINVRSADPELEETLTSLEELCSLLEMILGVENSG